MQLCDDESKVAMFKWYHEGKHIAEAEAVTINDHFDVSTYRQQEVTSPVRKRSFDPPAGRWPAGPLSNVETASRDVNRLLD